MQIEDNISATFLPPTILNRGTTIVEVSVDCPDERYAVADLLLPSGVSWPKYATGMIRFGAGQNQKGSIRLLVNNAPAALTYIVQVWTVPCAIYDKDPNNAWQHWTAHQQYHVAVAAEYNPGPSYSMVWNDEFDGVELDMNSWTFETGGGGWGNHELETYTPGQNMYLENSQLVIVARQLGKNYTSTRIKTQGKRSFSEGLYAARMKLPYGQGIWPAFWMLGE
jgi:hypothetical protein